MGSSPDAFNVTCGIAAPDLQSTDDPTILACGGYTGGMRFYSRAASGNVTLTAHGANQANTRRVPIESVLDQGSVTRHNGYIYMRFGKYRIVIFNKNKTIVTATAS